MQKLAILIPTLEGREAYLHRLMDIIKPQEKIYGNRVEIITLKDNKEKTTGWKRNMLTEMAIQSGATHRAFIDDDDTVSHDYLDLNMPGVLQDFDCNSLVGLYSLNGRYDRPFYHSLKYDHWWQDQHGYYRNPNHLNVVKLSLIRDIPFQDKTIGEDGCWSEDIFKAGVLKTEYEITKPFYNYLCQTK